MANYLTESFLLTVFAEQDLIDLTDRRGVGEINQAVLASAIAAAEGEFHSYVARRYAVPLDLESETDELAETIRGNLVTLLTYRLWSPPRKQTMPQSVRDAYKDALAWLQKVADGKVTLGSSTSPAASSESPAATEYDTEDREFTRNRLSGL
jgi:phage gp36-like protein